ncbi:Acyl-CoA 6-desaturase [Camelus dromedarius]|uniref:Acyl-CoA 6-desaturase n=1 Tax=Camelus dromedarius TaxID=9838 RepID=A0A5N4E140_CAMDR|nr:Acyl-CoA 6-desaturase [Camelus dromedarius]
MPTFSWEEIQKHNLCTDRWLVIDHKVYNITKWSSRHPRGFRVIGHYAGEGATDAFLAFHRNLSFVLKFMKPLLIGDLAPEEPSQDHSKNLQITEDFRALRKTTEEMNLFKTNHLFFLLLLAHIFIMETITWFTVFYFGNGWIPIIIMAFILAASQAPAGWLQHDFGHLSVYKKSTWNHIVHKFTIGHLKVNRILKTLKSLLSKDKFRPVLFDVPHLLLLNGFSYSRLSYMVVLALEFPA